MGISWKSEKKNNRKVVTHITPLAVPFLGREEVLHWQELYGPSGKWKSLKKIINNKKEALQRAAEIPGVQDNEAVIT